MSGNFPTAPGTSIPFSPFYSGVERVREATGNEDVDILYGVTYDDRAQDELRVILIAAGFGESTVVPKPLRPVDFPTHADPYNFDIPAFIRYGDADYPPRKGN